MQIILIAAMSINRVIGLNNTIPWHIKGEQKLFKEHTYGHTVIMGRKTYESIGKPLPGRKNIILTSQKKTVNNQEILIANNIQEALNYCKADNKVFIIGGANIYEQTICMADYIYLSIINRNIDGDSYFPIIDDNFMLISSNIIKLSEEITFNIYKKK